MEFDIQTELREMRHENNAANLLISGKVDEGFSKGSKWMHEHELLDQKRFGEVNATLNTLKGLQTTARWLVRSAIVAVFALMVDVVLMVGPWLVKLLAAKGN